MTNTASLHANTSSGNALIETPTLPLLSSRLRQFLPENSEVFLKLELFQQAGSFKARGVMKAIAALNEEQRASGVTAVSAGNHALAVSWGANANNLSASVVMPKTADPVRVDGCKALGAKVVLVDNVADAFAECDRQVEEEGRTMLHPFESEHMIAGAMDVGLELCAAVPDMEVAVIPVGGGGLIAGMSKAIRAACPDCEIIGVEPEGANSMQQSFEKGEPVKLTSVNTIADSLGAPMALPISFNETRKNVSRIITLPDSDLRIAMRRLFEALKIAPEPACASTFAAICGPLRKQLAGKRIGIIACGSNIGLEKFSKLIDETD